LRFPQQKNNNNITRHYIMNEETMVSHIARFRYISTRQQYHVNIGLIRYPIL